MGIHGVEKLSVGQWVAICEGWNAAHADKPKAPTDDELEAAWAEAKANGL